MANQKIFFSYSRIDGSAFALRLAVDLKKKGYDVWIDQEDIRAGMEWDTEIEKALETCDCVLFLETEKSVLSNNVLDEVYYALEQNKKVIPLIYVDSKTPFRLKRLQHINFTKDYDAGLAMLLNELESGPSNVAYQPVNTLETGVTKKASALNKTTALLLAIVALLIVAGLFFFSKKNEDRSLVQITSERVDTAQPAPSNEQAVSPAADTIAVAAEKNAVPISSRPILAKASQRKPAVPPKQTSAIQNAAPAQQANNNDLSGTLVGNWRLVGVQPKAESHRGYLKVEAAGDNKVSLKTYIQFYYPASNTSSYLTVFNAFAGCNACTPTSSMKLVTEDVAVGSRTIKKQEQDEPGGHKAGEIIMDASANKSVRATTTLQIVNNSLAIITIRQPATIALAHQLMLEPFEYTFRFTKDD